MRPYHLAGPDVVVAVAGERRWRVGAHAPALALPPQKGLPQNRKRAAVGVSVESVCLCSAVGVSVVSVMHCRRDTGGWCCVCRVLWALVP